MIIYCIEDINDLRYIGSTKNTIGYRLSKHKTDARLGRNVSSSQLNLYNCIIYELETCDKDNSWERETYWMKKLNSVNQRKGQTKDKKNYNKKYYKSHKEKLIKYQLDRYYKSKV